MESNRKLSNFEVLRLVRDARTTKHSERHVLNALCLRANPEKAYSCFPSIDQLSDDCQLDAKTVQRMLKALDAKQLIKRVERPFTTNMFFVNVPLLAEQATVVLAAEKKKKDELEQSPFGELTVPTSETPAAPAKDYVSMADLVKMIEEDSGLEMR